MQSLITIGEASNLTGIPTKTIRFYEEIKLIHPAKRLENSYRAYTTEDLEVLMLIKEAKSLGLPLKDIKEIVHLCISQGCDSANNFFKDKLTAYLGEIETKIKDLQDLQKKLLDYKETSVKIKAGNCSICKNNC